MNRTEGYEAYVRAIVYLSEGRDEELEIPEGARAPQQNAKDLAKVVEDKKEVYRALETE